MSAGPCGANVVVLGGVNVDMVAQTPRRPAGGETLVATSFWRTAGGKGANQAAAAARAGADVTLVAAVGRDEPGAEQLHDLRRRGVGTDLVAVLTDAPTGVAMITVTPDGENTIVVVPGANAHLGAGQVDMAAVAAQHAAVLMLQSEVDAALLDRMAARVSAARVIVNNGPWVALAEATLRRADPLIVNQREALDATGAAAADVAPSDLARMVRRVTGARSAVVTLGSAGASISDVGVDGWVPADTAPVVVDPTGAGDTFAGTLAARVAFGDTLFAATRGAVRAAGEAVAWRGARPPAAAGALADGGLGC